MITAFNIFAVFGAQILLWFFFPWWVALLSLPSAILVAAALAFILMPITSRMATCPALWEYHKALSPAFLFAAGQAISAYFLAYVFL